MIGQTLGHYRILEKIGAGGMGEVYCARDEHLNRDVAIKVLPAGTLADEAARKRFRKEAEALSKLNHPNIQTVFDFDIQQGVDFLVTEYVAGASLGEKLAAGPLGEKEIARLGTQLAEGLAAAHAERVVHRDLKPGNLRLKPDGRLKILDFGLAKLLKPFDVATPTESFTETFAAAGTLPYMAPEQLRGEGVDHRSDIWAAGAVLYEMATGRRPFEAKLATALVADIHTKPPPSPRQFNLSLSSRLEDIILKCLEKEPENRYQSANELAVDLRRLATPTAVVAVARRPAIPRRWALAVLGASVLLVVVVLGLNVGDVRERLWGSLAAGTPEINSLAVLPMKNLMGDPKDDYFVEGMHEALTTELSKISGLKKVIARTSAMRYQGTDKSLPQIARELGVAGLIEGSVLREGDQVRITVQLIHGPSGRQLWAGSFQRDLRGILVLQSEVARVIAREIRIAVRPAEAARLARARPVNPEAHRLYLRGRHHWNKRTPESFQKAIEQFLEVIEIDPTYALAYVGLADAYLVQSNYGLWEPKVAHSRAEAAARKALDLDDSLGEAHASLAMVRFFSWEWSDAEKEFQRAIELSPNDPTAHHFYGTFLSAMGRHQEAIIEGRRAQELDPLSLPTNANVGARFYFARQYDQAIEECRRTLQLDPAFGTAHNWLGSAYLKKGMVKEALAEMRQGDPAVGRPLGEALDYALTGRKDEARRLLVQLKEQGYFPSVFMAGVYLHLDERDDALQSLQRGYERRDQWIVLAKEHPMLDPLRDDPRFQDLLRRMNFPQ